MADLVWSAYAVAARALAAADSVIADRIMDVAVYTTTITTSHRTYESGSERTMSAAIRTAGMPPSARPTAARRSYFSLRMNFMLHTGIRNAHDPIMIGNAAVGFIPSRLIMIRHGA